MKYGGLKCPATSNFHDRTENVLSIVPSLPNFHITYLRYLYIYRKLKDPKMYGIYIANMQK